MKLLILFGIVVVSAFAAISDGEQTKQSSGTSKTAATQGKESSDLAQFHVLFRDIRQEQARGILSLKNVSNNKERIKVLKQYIEQLSKEGEKAKREVESKEYSPRQHEIPQKQSLKDAVSNIVKNTAFFCDAVVNFPKRLQKEFEDNQKLRELVTWGMDFADKIDLYDDDTKKIVEIAKIELGLLDRPEGFVNPYFKTKDQKQRELYDEWERKQDEKRAERKNSIKKDKTEL
ncbi:unnamed protein product [Bursaphelenchus okinawaensis]|uniref:Uncharacterized protein n=1 Tax=Bursaphelenchus okinawaensis TaxID=465554 RepID=A0A811KX37_9BILA|nr:unnamed protein product [Bursaphelenchus okinawaensis]CAG9113131.1 unnamed protein product [Bursaphelenchus okinawaensis]